MTSHDGLDILFGRPHQPVLNVQMMAGVAGTKIHGTRMTTATTMAGLPLGNTNRGMGQPFGTIPTIGAGTTT